LPDLIKTVEASEGKEIALTIVRSGIEQTVKVTAAARPKSEHVEVTVARPDVSEEIRRVEEALQKLRAKAGDKALRLYSVRPGVVAPRAEVNRVWSSLFDNKNANRDFPGDLKVQITKDGDQPAKIHVQRGEKEWDVTEDKLSELPEDIRPHVQQMFGKGIPLHLRVPAGTVKGDRNIRVTPEGKVEGELRLGPMIAVPPVAPTPPAAPRAPVEKSNRGFSYRTERGALNDEPKLDTILKKLDSLDRLERDLRDLRKDVDALRKSERN
jgi:hypothetical protein